MNSKTVLFFLFVAFANILKSQCNISELQVEASECNVSGEFFVTLDFNHVGTSQKFRILGNGINYGTFYYDSIPVKIGPLSANCTTNYEFVVQDVENTACSAFTHLGTKCCDNNCSLKLYDVKAYDCNDGKYTLSFNMQHNAPDNGFDLYNNGVHYGYYQYSSLPLTLKNFPAKAHQATNQIVVCANDNLHCCDTIQLTNPCICNIYNIRSQIVDCDEADSTYSVKFTFKHQLTSDSFRVGGNNHNYGIFGYNQLPITIHNLKFSNTSQYEFLFVDKNDPFCFSSYQLDTIRDCHHPCQISDVMADVLECNAEGNFYVNLTFKEENTSVAGFEVRGNGKSYGTFQYGEGPYKIGPLKGDCNTLYEFVVKDKELLDCSASTHLKDSICCQANCHLSDMTIRELCQDSILQGFYLDFKHSNTSSDFAVSVNNKVVLTFKYADLPVYIANAGFDQRVGIIVKDSINHDCKLVGEFTFACQVPDAPCKLYDMVVAPSDCNDKGEFYARLKFLSTNPGAGGFVLKVNGQVFDTLPYGHDVYEIGPLKGDCATIYKFFMYDLFHPDCTEEFAFKEKVCCGSGDCTITDLVVKATDCNDKGEFYARLSFKATNPGSNGFYVQVNGKIVDTLQYGHDVYEIGPLKGDCTTLYKFLVIDAQYECRGDVAFTEKICCNGECKFSEVQMKVSECNDKEEFYAYLAFNVANPGNQGFLVKVNGVNFDTLKYGESLYKIGPLKGDCATLYKFLLIDIQKECRAEYSFTEKVCCDKADCILKEPILAFLPCVDNKYNVQINFVHAGTSAKFRLKVDGILINIFDFASLPVTITGLKPKQAHELVIFDAENEACRLVVAIPAIECISGTNEDSSSSTISINVAQDILTIQSDHTDKLDDVIVYDMNGRMILFAKPNQASFQTNVDRFCTGLYIAKIKVGQEILTKKFFIP